MRKAVDHYLPSRAYLKFFECQAKPGSVYLYRRSGKEPVQVNIGKVARERNLYVRDEVEQALEAIERAGEPILARLNNPGPGPVLNISGLDEAILARFVGYQATRTPAQRKVMANLHAGVLRAATRFMAAHDPAWESLTPPAPPGVDPEMLRRLILEGRSDVTVSGENLMLDALEAAEQIARIVWTKQLSVLTAGTDETFLTSDHPVALVRPEDTPSFFGTGFLMSNVAFPIGRKAVLYWTNEDKKQPSKGPEDPVRVYVHAMSPAQTRAINKSALSHAEKYLFSSEKRASVQKLFDRTKQPERVETVPTFPGLDEAGPSPDAAV
jgi:hypothetical protein